MKSGKLTVKVKKAPAPTLRKYEPSIKTVKTKSKDA